MTFSPGLHKILACLALLSLGVGGSVHGQASNQPESAQPSAAKLREQALAAMDAGDEDLAFTLARSAKRLAPEDPQVVFLMALLLGDRHRFPEAIQMLDDLSEKVPATRLPALGQTAEWMVKFGWWDQGESRYRILLKELPDSTLVHRNLASLLTRQGRRREAAIHLHKLCVLGDVQESELRSLLIQLHPFAGDAIQESFDPIGSLGIARNEMAQDDWNAARERLTSSPGEHAEGVGLLGRIHAHLGDWESLQTWADENPESARDSADYWFAIGTSLARQGNHREAVVAFCESVLRDQTDSQAYLALAESLTQLGSNDEAETAKQRAEMIQQTQALGAKMATDPMRSNEEVTQLIELLEKLHRPMEALSWQGVRLAYRRNHGVLTDAQAQQVLNGIMEDRKRQIERNQTEASREFLLCGLDLESFQHQER